MRILSSPYLSTLMPLKDILVSLTAIPILKSVKQVLWVLEGRMKSKEAGDNFSYLTFISLSHVELDQCS